MVKNKRSSVFRRPFYYGEYYKKEKPPSICNQLGGFCALRKYNDCKQGGLSFPVQWETH